MTTLAPSFLISKQSSPIVKFCVHLQVGKEYCVNENLEANPHFFFQFFIFPSVTLIIHMDIFFCQRFLINYMDIFSVTRDMVSFQQIPIC